MQQMKYGRQIETPIGSLLLLSDETLLHFVGFIDTLEAVSFTAQDAAPILSAERELGEYFQGKRKVFTIPLAMKGTPFARKVWEATKEVPFGTRVAYKSLAEQLGIPKGSRGVGRAVASNPLLLVIPCHRVIPLRGNSVGGYAGGIHRKDWLLRHERSLVVSV